MKHFARSVLWCPWRRRLSPPPPAVEARTRKIRRLQEHDGGFAEQRAMSFAEGQIYEGEVSALGGDGPLQRWIAVAPFGKPELHSIGNALELHYMPVCVASQLIAEGRLYAVASDENHPVIRLQRAKERSSIRDNHMGIYENNLRKMIALLEEAVRNGESYTSYAAGEILAMLKNARYRYSYVDEIDVIEGDVLKVIERMNEAPGSWPIGVLWRAELWS